MDVILGIDIGGSTTKIVGLRTDGSVLSMLRGPGGGSGDQPVRGPGQLSHQQPALPAGCAAGGAHTAWGASYVEGDIYGLPTCKVDRVLCHRHRRSGPVGPVLRRGGQHGHRHRIPLGVPRRHSATCAAAGSAAAPWAGSAASWWGMERFGQIKKLAESGDLDHVDLTMKDITVRAAPTLDPDMTARQLRRSGGGRHSRGPGGRRGEPGAPGHRHHDGAGLPEL